MTVAGIYFVIVSGHWEALKSWPAYYLFFANFLTEHIPTLYPTWSLSIEEQFYLLWPLVLNVVAVSGVLRVFGVVPFELGPLWVHLPDATYAPLLLGAGLALMLHDPRGFALVWRLLGGAGMPIVGLGVLLALVFLLLPQVLAGWPYLLVHLAMTGWLATLVLREDSWLHGMLRLRPLVRIGMVSYGIYLLHLMILHMVRLAGEPLGFAQDSQTSDTAALWVCGPQMVGRGADP